MTIRWLQFLAIISLCGMQTVAIANTRKIAIDKNYFSKDCAIKNNGYKQLGKLQIASYLNAKTLSHDFGNYNNLDQITLITPNQHYSNTCKNTFNNSALLVMQPHDDKVVIHKLPFDNVSDTAVVLAPDKSGFMVEFHARKHLYICSYTMQVAEHFRDFYIKDLTANCYAGTKPELSKKYQYKPAYPETIALQFDFKRVNLSNRLAQLQAQVLEQSTFQLDRKSIIYSKPIEKTNYRTKAYHIKGDEVYALTSTHDWIKITYDNFRKTGWLPAKDLTQVAYLHMIEDTGVDEPAAIAIESHEQNLPYAVVEGAVVEEAVAEEVTMQAVEMYGYDFLINTMKKIDGDSKIEDITRINTMLKETLPLYHKNLNEKKSNKYIRGLMHEAEAMYARFFSKGNQTEVFSDYMQTFDTKRKNADLFLKLPPRDNYLISQFRKEYITYLYIGEGLYVYHLDGEYLKDMFVPYLPESQAEFVWQVANERNEVSMMDAGIVIPYHKLAERAIFWEDYLKKYPNSVYKKEARTYLNVYIHNLFIGMDNTRWTDDNITAFIIYEQNLSPSVPSIIEKLKQRKNSELAKVANKMTDFMSLSFEERDKRYPVKPYDESGYKKERWQLSWEQLEQAIGNYP